MSHTKLSKVSKEEAFQGRTDLRAVVALAGADGTAGSDLHDLRPIAGEVGVMDLRTIKKEQMNQGHKVD